MPTQVTSENFAANTIVTYAEWTGSLIPKVSNVTVANSSYTILDDTAVSTNGGYVVITGTGFENGATVIINEVTATAVSFINSSTLHVQVPAKSAATYDVYVVNPDGATAIGVNKLTYSSTPTWVTDTTLTGQSVDTAFNITFNATGAVSYANTTALPAGTELLSNGYFYGTVTGIVEETTYNFTIRATDAENQDSDKNFSLTVVVVTAPSSVEYLVVAGGGGGGWAGSGGGGAGAGGVVYGTDFTPTSGQQYTVTVGGGANGSASRYSNVLNRGSNSVFASTTTAIGGGGGSSAYSATSYGSPGGSGGSGGGGAQRNNASGGSGTSGQGTSGGNATTSTGGDAGGGGGGASTPGASAPGSSTGGNGGTGTSSYSSWLSVVSIGQNSGGTYYIAGGGGGGGSPSSGVGGLGGGGAGNVTTGTDGSSYTGGGGGGSGYSGTRGGNGGSGVVILRYSDTYNAASATTGSPTVTTSGGYRYYTFTGSGSITW